MSKHATLFDDEMPGGIEGHLLPLDIFHVVLEHITCNAVQLAGLRHDGRLGIGVDLSQVFFERHSPGFVLDQEGEEISLASYLFDLDTLFSQELVLVGVGDQTAVSFFLVFLGVAVRFEKALL